MKFEPITPANAKTHLHECTNMEEVIGCIWMGNIRLALERMKEIGHKEGRLIGAQKMQAECVAICATVDDLPVSNALKECGNEIADIIEGIDPVGVIYGTQKIKPLAASDAIDAVRSDLAELAK